ncbi:MAG: hypothetical protein JO105_20745, partial [Hyphomicrobiales bacterium]|nr:hypothetical protein [Hyphomicrobiales bacterium]
GPRHMIANALASRLEARQIVHLLFSLHVLDGYGVRGSRPVADPALSPLDDGPDCSLGGGHAYQATVVEPERVTIV